MALKIKYEQRIGVNGKWFRSSEGIHFHETHSSDKERKYVDRADGKHYENTQSITSMEQNAICGKVYSPMGREVLINHPDDMDKNCPVCMYIIGIDILSITGKTTEELGLVEDYDLPDLGMADIPSIMVMEDEEIIPTSPDAYILHPTPTEQPVITKPTARRISRKGK